MSTVDASELGLDLTKKKTKKTTTTSKGGDGETTEKKVKKTSSTKKKEKKEEVPVDEEELNRIQQQASEFFNKTYQNFTKSQKTSNDDSHLDELTENELEEINDLIESLKSGGTTTTTTNEDDYEFAESAEATWLDTDRDYYYPELLDRITDMLRRKNPDLSGTRAKRIRMKIPQVAKDGPKKTVFINFAEICTNLHRQQEHVLAYLVAELGTSGTTDSNSRLTVRGSFKGKDIETVLRKYISEYVVCGVCGSLDTILSRDANTRLYSLNCMSCGASRTVSAVKQGYMANIVPRKRRTA